MSAASKFYSFVVKNSKGANFNFSTLKGKAVLVVNVASKCGLTPQYKGLEELYKAHKDQGLEIIGFPSNQFGSQEPGTDEEISSFCSLNYGVTFPIMAKSDVNGENANDVYKFLKEMSANGLEQQPIQWNFEKFLIDKHGNLAERIGPKTTPESIEPSIVHILKQ